jgi:hypothetical protein
MNAQEAYAMALATNTSASNKEVSSIRQLIKDAASKGGYAVRVDSINADIQKLLKDEGFKVSHFSDQRDNDDYWTISWTGIS